MITLNIQVPKLRHTIFVTNVHDKIFNRLIKQFLVFSKLSICPIAMIYSLYFQKDKHFLNTRSQIAMPHTLKIAHFSNAQ